MFRRSNLALVSPVESPLHPPVRIHTHRIPDWWASPASGVIPSVALCRHIVKAFCEGRLGVHRIVAKNCGGRHVYFTRDGGRELWIFKDNPSLKFEACIARQVRGVLIGNASSLEGQKQPRKVYWLDGRMMRIQRALQDVMPMVPFRMFEENGLDVATFRLIEKGPEVDLRKLGAEWRRKDLEHFTGAMVFSLLGKGQAGHYLFDLDRAELAKGAFNAFLSKLPRAASSIAEAYEMLKPEELVAYERGGGRGLLRQGEWFFIPQADNYLPMKDGRLGHPLRHATGRLSVKGHRTHTTSKISECGEFVAGVVGHEGREHVPLELEKGVWYKPVANNATVSFRVTGGVD